MTYLTVGASPWHYMFVHSHIYLRRQSLSYFHLEIGRSQCGTDESVWRCWNLDLSTGSIIRYLMTQILL